MAYNVIRSFTIIIFSVLLATSYGDGEENKLEKEDPPDVSADKETICSAAQVADADMKIGVSGIMDYDDLLKLVVWNHKYNLRKGGKKFDFPAEVNWKRSVLDKLAAIFTASCPAEFVPPEFINVAKELFMVYQNSVNKSVDHTTAWNVFTPILEKCREQQEKFELMSNGFHAYGMKLKTKEGETEELKLLPPMEEVDRSLDIDVIIDTVWWLFSFSFGSCYWKAGSPSIWAARYKKLFDGDFLMQIKSRWIHAGPETDFGVIFGDFNMQTILHNIRICVTGAYNRNGLADRQLVRSIMLAPTNYGIENTLNRKIGEPI